jgi:RNA polymerase sigma-54 factor
MILKDVAEAIGVHESTVSRVTTGMLIATPQGTFPLKSFFSASLAGKGEEDGSAAAVRHRIQQLVKNENPKAPLSDDALAKMITDEGTHLARRTVAKYREMLNIPSSFQRKRQAKLAAGMH